MSNGNRKGQLHIPGGHIGWIEATAMLLIYSTVKTFYAFPSTISKLAGTTAWSVPIFSALASVFWLWALVSVLKAHPGEDIIAITRSLMGPYAAFGFGTVFCLINIGIVGTAAAELLQAIGTTLLPTTPPFFLVALGFSVITYVSIHGVEVLGRVAAIVAVLAVGLLALTTILSIDMWKPASLLPLLGPGIGPLLKTYGVRQAMYLEVLPIGVLAPYLRKPDDSGRTVRWAVGATAVYSALAILICEVMFPYPSLNLMVEPLQRVTRLIYLGRFFQRFDAVLSPVWLLSAMVHGSVGVVATSLGATSTLSLSSPKTLKLIIVVVAALMTVVAILVPNLALAIVADFDLLHPYSVILLDTWPLALWAAGRLRGRAGRRKGDSPG